MKEGGRVKLIVQPDDGLAPVLESIDRARKSLDFIIFRLDSKDIEKAAAAAVTRSAWSKLSARLSSSPDISLRMSASRSRL